ncbi:uncharacterized protein LOC141606189 [Silene latifolia]|uniref:uncharacterized protein LOC141606189 n=1 Tax=Silene latifolia TaxID=37657 RepID=UPI003D77F247
MAETTVEVFSVKNDDAEFEKLKHELGNKEIRSSDQELVMQTTIRNFTKGNVHPIEKHFWHGRNLSFWENALWPNSGFTATQQGTLPQGVKFGLVYADGHDTTARKFVVAFDSASGKAYAEARPIGPVDWNVVEVKLGMAGEKTDYSDPILGGRTVAEISGVNAFATFYN